MIESFVGKTGNIHSKQILQFQKIKYSEQGTGVIARVSFGNVTNSSFL